MESVVYLLHLESPMCPGRHTAQHYLGSAEDVSERLREHRLTRMVQGENGSWRKFGQGAKMLAWANTRGIGWRVVRILRAADGDGRKLESKIKKRHANNMLCPLCHPENIKGGIELDLNSLEGLEF